MGTAPEMSEPGKIYSKLIPYKDLTAKILLDIAMKPTAAMARIPFHVVFKKGMVIMAEIKTTDKATKIFI